MLLNDIQISFRNPVNGAIYKMLGVVLYKRPVSATGTIGHYTAVFLRHGQTWVEYDDLKTEEKNMEKECSVTPALLIYSIL